MITRPRDQAAGMARRLTDLGAEVLVFPAIAIEPPADWSPLDTALAGIDNCDWLIFTSANGVRYFFQRWREKQLDIRVLAGIKIAAIGPATARALEERGLRPDWQPPEYVAEAVAAGLGPQLAGQRVLLPRAAIARPFLAADLRRQGAMVTEVAVYRTTARAGDATLLQELLAAGSIAAITFTSPSTVRSLLELLGKEALTLMRDVEVFCIGPITATAAREAGLTVTATAAEYTETGLIQAIRDYYTGRKKGEKTDQLEQIAF
jgi:uroporphyrinogen III methyltransferase/synthase